jgi:hypothetical protein
MNFYSAIDVKKPHHDSFTAGTAIKGGREETLSVSVLESLSHSRLCAFPSVSDGRFHTDLSTVGRKIESNSYNSLDDFRRDVILIADNAIVCA